MSPVDLGLEGKIAVVTGASAGIGLAICKALAAEGVHVIAGARTRSAELDALGGSVEAVTVDLATPAGPAELVAVALAHGRVDIVVNNVGVAPMRLTGFLDVTDEQWLATMNLNLMAAVRTVRAALPAMIAAGRGSIVTTSSVNSFLPDPAVIDQLLQVAVQRGRAARHPGQHRQPGPGLDLAVARRRRRGRERCPGDRRRR